MKNQNSKHKIPNTKNSKGITLVALIITIIVLLILAVVAISAVTGDGIIGHAKNAQEEYEIAQEKEQIALAVNEAFMAGLGKITQGNLETALNKSIGEGKYLVESTNGAFKVKITETGREYTINANGTIEGPTGGIGSGGSGETLGKATVGIKVEKNSTINGEKYSSTNPIIPAGFKAINTETAKWDAASGPQVDNGLVIQDEAGNEFVWVKVTDNISTTEYTVTINNITYIEPDVKTGSGNQYDAVATNLQRAECVENPDDSDTVLTSADFEAELTSAYARMATSVNEYDGFYVGRFETSRNGANPQSKRSSAASGSGQEIITAYNSSTENDWYGLYALNKKYKTSSVTGSMIWGIQYDKMMSWMGSATDSTISGYNTNRTCGTAPGDVIKNVYDLYGNSFEWTLEGAGESGRVPRGGLYSHGYSARNRGTGTVPTYTVNAYYGSRLALYVNL